MLWRAYGADGLRERLGHSTASYCMGVSIWYALDGKPKRTIGNRQLPGNTSTMRFGRGLRGGTRGVVCVMLVSGATLEE